MRTTVISSNIAKKLGTKLRQTFEALESEGVFDAFEDAERLHRKLKLHKEASQRYRTKGKKRKR